MDVARRRLTSPAAKAVAARHRVAEDGSGAVISVMTEAALTKSTRAPEELYRSKPAKVAVPPLQVGSQLEDPPPVA